MMALPITVDAAPDYGTANSQAIYQEFRGSPRFAGVMPSLIVSIEGPACIIIDPPSPPYVMSQAERDALDRAYWRSVEVLDEGYEG